MSSTPSSFNPFPNQNKKFGLASKYEGLEDNIWLKLAVNPGEKVVNLGLGNPDYTPAPEVLKNLEVACRQEASYLNHQYASPLGHVGLVNALAKMYGGLLHREIDPMNEVLITPGGCGGLFYAIMSNVGPGDEVVMIEPRFDMYEKLVKLASGTPVFVQLRPTQQVLEDASSASWKLDMKELRAMLSSKTKAIILNSPNVPTGKVFTRQELLEIGNLCKEFNVLIISDEVYEWIVYDGNEHVRITGMEDFWDRTITVGSAGKAFGLTGWKLGYCYGPAALIHNLRVAHLNCIYVNHTPVQEALAVTLENEIKLLGTPQSHFSKICKELARKRDRIVNSLRSIGTTPIVPEGGYFVMVNWKGIEDKIDLSKETDKQDDVKFVQWLCREKKIIGIPLSAFYSESRKHLAKNYIRFNFYKTEETLDEADKVFATFQ